MATLQDELVNYLSENGWTSIFYNREYYSYHKVYNTPYLGDVIFMTNADFNNGEFLIYAESIRGNIKLSFSCYEKLASFLHCFGYDDLETK